MAGFNKNKKTGKWYCDKCGVEVDIKIILAVYNYFGKNKDHICKKDKGGYNEK